MAQTNLTGTTDRRIDALLALLSDNAMIVISAAKIAREIGVTRSTVWRWIEKLRSLGVRVKGVPRSGYQIEKVADVLVPKLLHKRLHQGPIGKRIHHFFKTDSTNSVAMRLGEQGEPHGTLCHRGGTNGGARPGRAHLAFGKNEWHLYDRPSAASHFAAAGAADHDGCGTCCTGRHPGADRRCPRPALAE